MKKVLFLLHIPPPVHGSSIIGKTIIESRTVLNAFDCRFINLIASESIADTGKVTIKKMVGFIAVWFTLLRTIITFRPKLCYLALTTTGTAFYRDVTLIALLRLFGIKRIYHLHNKGIKNAQKKIINKWLYSFVFKNANVIVLSDLLYYDIESFVSKEQLFVCANGIVDDDIDSEIEFTKKDYSEKVKLLFLSNLIESKGVRILLEACAILQSRQYSFSCNFIGGVGDISIKAFDELVEQKNLSQTVTYLGTRYGKEKSEAFRQADIFVFPTFYNNECFPLVLLEAMKYGLPVVSTNEGAISAIVDDGSSGFIVPKRDVEMLANKIEILINNKQLRVQMGDNGKQKFANNYTLSIFEKTLVDILHK